MIKSQKITMMLVDNSYKRKEMVINFGTRVNPKTNATN